MKREEIPLPELMVHLNRELRSQRGCEDAEFEGTIERLEKPSPSGLNWSADDLSVPERCYKAAARVLADALRRFNVSW